MWQLRNDEAVRVEAAVKQVLPPCQIKCPIKEAIQRTNVLISLLPKDPAKAKEGIIQIGDYLYERNPFFTVCGYICGICEKECNYKTKGGSIRRRLLKRFLSEEYIPYLPTKKPLDVKKTKDKVAVIGGGPAGLFCAWELAKEGYQVTIFDNNPKLGGALRYIPEYRLPERVLDNAIHQLVRIGGIEVRGGVKVDGGNALDALKQEGFKAFFVSIGTHYPRPLAIGLRSVDWTGIENVQYGLTFLGESSLGLLPLDHFKGKRVLVIGGGNVAFDVARTAVRYGGKVTIVCLETWDRTSMDRLPADEEEIEAAHQEGIEIVYQRGVNKIIGQDGKFHKIEAVKCTKVFDENWFNPQFDMNDMIDIEGEVLLISIGQMWDRTFLQNNGLLDEKGRLSVHPLTHQSLLRPDVFLGGDIRRVGFMVDAMAAGREAADTIDKYLSGEGVQRWLIRYEASDAPRREVYKPALPKKWLAPEKRINFEPFEIGFTLEEAIAEARRCLECGPCISCKACVASGIQKALPAVTVDEVLCSGCGICVTACNYNTCHLVEMEQIYEGRVIGYKNVSSTDPVLCKACGMCVSACPSKARTLEPDISRGVIPPAEKELGIVCFYCKFGWAYVGGEEKFAHAKTAIPVVCIGKVDITEIIDVFKKGGDGVLLFGCGDGDCHFQDGNQELKKRVYLLNKVLEAFGIEKERLEVVTAIDPEGETVPGIINRFRDKIKTLGPLS